MTPRHAHLFLTAALASLLAGPASTQTPTTESQAQGLTETIHGEIQERLEIQKQPPAIHLEVGEIIDSGTAQTEAVLQGARPIPSDADYKIFATLNSDQILRPWLPLIPQPPLVTFHPGLTRMTPKTWEFRVSNQDGEVVKTITGKGTPPRQIAWDGVDKKGDYITVGTLYAYEFLTADEHGNIQTFPGETFHIDALLYRHRGRMVIEFANTALFIENQPVFRPAMAGFWERAIDAVREHSGKPLTVEIYADRDQLTLADARREAAITSIAEATRIAATDIRHTVKRLTERGDITRLVLSVR